MNAPLSILFFWFRLTPLALLLSVGQPVPAGHNHTDLPRLLIVYSGIVGKDLYTLHNPPCDLFLYTTADKKLRRLTDHQGKHKSLLGGAIIQPVFSPDHQRVLFLADSADSKKADILAATDLPQNPHQGRDIWMLELTTGHLRRYTRGGRGLYTTILSPNQRFFTALLHVEGGFVGPNPEVLYLFEVQTGQQHRLYRSKHRITAIQWSKDSQFLTFLDEWDRKFYRISRQGGKARPLGTLPAGKDLLTHEQQQAGFVAGEGGKELFFVPQNRPKQRLLSLIGDPTASGFTLDTALLSGDKRSAIVTARRNDPQQTTRLYAVDMTTRKSRLLTTLPYFVVAQAWSKNQHWIICQRLVGDWKLECFAVSVVDGHRETLFLPEQDLADPPDLPWVELP